MYVPGRKTIFMSLALCLILTGFSIAFFFLDLTFESITSIDFKFPFSTKPANSATSVEFLIPSDEIVRNALREGTNSEKAIASVPSAIKAIFDPHVEVSGRITCPTISTPRYGYLRRLSGSNEKRKYFFALDLYNNQPMLPRLFGSIVETCRFLNPQSCTISVVEGRSTDGTYETLKLLQTPLETLGIQYLFNTSSLNPSRENWRYRIETLAYFRNLATQSIAESPDDYHEEAVVLFLNDATFCPGDILELIHQRIFQKADMTCGMDWAIRNNQPSFYDVWVTRGITGDSFFFIPEDGSWDRSDDLFWNDEKSKSRLAEYKPFQVFDCWNGGVVFSSRVLKAGLRFRAHTEGECYQGEPQLWGKDMWYHGFGKIAVIPSVNVAYNYQDALRVKEVKGWAIDHFDVEDEGLELKIDWQVQPPEKVKCIVVWGNQFWVPWNESLPLNQSEAVLVPPG